MGLTKIGSLKTPESRAKLVAILPTAPYDYYGVASNDVDSVAWRGGEICYLTVDNRFYIQTATSGTTATWYRFATQTSAT